ncbi:MAG: hypothetical protein H6559_03940 [Lewinellaceae bacterium]|nr:hypothetical protein [Lewinellaceae bacterium]
MASSIPGMTPSLRSTVAVAVQGVIRKYGGAQQEVARSVLVQVGNQQFPDVGQFHRQRMETGATANPPPAPSSFSKGKFPVAGSRHDVLVVISVQA